MSETRNSSSDEDEFMDAIDPSAGNVTESESYTNKGKEKEDTSDHDKRDSSSGDVRVYKDANGCCFGDVTDPTKAGFFYSIDGVYTHIWQQEGHTCLAYSAASMMTMFYRLTSDDKEIELSPQSMLCRDMTQLSTLRQHLTDKEFGLEKLEVQDVDESATEFEYLTAERYTVNSLRLCEGHSAIIEELKKNFGPQGNKYPMIGGCHKHLSFRHWVAASEYTKENPYEYDGPIRDMTDDGHAVLVTGLYARADSPTDEQYSIQVRNNCGDENARYWTTITVLCFVIVPSFETD